MYIDMEKRITEQSEEVKDYLFNTLEDIRKEGKYNMWGADKPLAYRTQISYELAKDTLLYWIIHYDELNGIYYWN